LIEQAGGAGGSFEASQGFLKPIGATAAQGALIFFSLFYLSCVLLTWRGYARRDAELPC